jgi:RimJ/RimL family protein N-acetyltransferase
MKGYTLLDALKNKDFDYIKYIPEEWYYDHLCWRIHHYLLNERCETCRNWHFCGKLGGRVIGTCDVSDLYWYDYHGHCPVWNVDLTEDSIHERVDGWERAWKTPGGKEITQISRGGVWQYLYSGKPKWDR